MQAAASVQGAGSGRAAWASAQAALGMAAGSAWRAAWQQCRLVQGLRASLPSTCIHSCQRTCQAEQHGPLPRHRQLLHSPLAKASQRLCCRPLLLPLLLLLLLLLTLLKRLALRQLPTLQGQRASRCAAVLPSFTASLRPAALAAGRAASRAG